MRLDTFFEKFELFADAPGAVAKMRELVLDLAATGRLIAPQTEWQTRPLKSLASKIGSGATPAGGRESYFAEGIPLIRSMNVYFSGFDPTGLVFLSDEQADELSNVVVQTDDVLLNITGASIGRVTTAPNEMAGARVNQHVTIIRPNSDLLSRFLSIFLASPSVQRMIDEIQVGATRQALTKGMIEQFDIPLPPLAEQKRIVAKVDELMALCDRLEAQQQERETRYAALARASLSRFAEAPTPANLDFLFHKSYTIDPADLRKSILTLAVQGKLVPQDAEDEPAESVIAKIEAAKAKLIQEKLISKRKPIDSLVASELPFTVPNTWHWCRLEDLVYSVGDGPHFSPKYVSPDEGIPFLSMRNITANGFSLGDMKYVSLSDHEVFCRKVKATKGDILYTKGGTTGIALVNDLDFEFSVWVHVAVLKIAQEHLFSRYISLVLNSPHCYEQSQRYTHGIGNRDLGLTRMVLITIPLPPLAEQRRIVAKVDQLMALVDQLETQLAASRAVAEKLLEALVAELTANGP